MKPYLRHRSEPFRQSEYPESTAFEAGYLVSKNAGWRSKRPRIDSKRCTLCEQCYLYCPDGVISINDQKVVIDFDFCKGCGICKKICRFGAIDMEDEPR